MTWNPSTAWWAIPRCPSYYEDELTAYTDVNSILNEYAMYALNGTMTAEEAMMEADALAEEEIAAAK